MIQSIHITVPNTPSSLCVFPILLDLCWADWLFEMAQFQYFVAELLREQEECWL